MHIIMIPILLLKFSFNATPQAFVPQALLHTH